MDKIGILIFIFLAQSCSQLKRFNSATTQIKYTLSDAIFEKEEYRSTDESDSFSASIRGTAHPSERTPGRFHFKLSPSVHFERLNYKSKNQIIDPRTNISSFRTVNYRRLAVMGNLQAIRDTHFGRFNYGLGFCPGIYHMSDDRDLDEFRMRSVIRMELHHTFFISNRFFIRMGPRIFFEEQITIFEGSLRFGFRWGEIKS